MSENDRAQKNDRRGKWGEELDRCDNRAMQQLIIPYLEDIRYQQKKWGFLSDSDEKTALSNPLPLDQKARFVRHIRECKYCYAELEFDLIVYATTDMLNDAELSNNYKEAVNQLLCGTEAEILRAQHQARTGRFRLIAILLMLALALSLSVGRSAIEPEPEEITIRTKGFYFGDLGLPEEIDFVDCAIAAHHDGARDFVFSQRLRAAEVDKLWRFDVEIMRAMYPQGELTYILPASFLFSEGSYAKRLEKGKRPEILYQIPITLKAFPHPEKEKAEHKLGSIPIWR